MKKIIAVLSAIVVASTLLVSCGADGKCDECGKAAGKVSDMDAVYADALDIDGEYCDDCLAVACV